MLDRRSLLKIGAAAPAVAVSAGVLSQVRALPLSGGKDFSPKTGQERMAVPTACWQCVTRCPAIAYVEDGRLVKMEGQPNSIRTHGVMCAKGQGGVNHVLRSRPHPLPDAPRRPARQRRMEAHFLGRGA